jgi:uncharacterized protein
MSDTIIKNLVAAGCWPETVAHCVVVSHIAVSIAERLDISINLELVRLGGLLHDIGRSRTQGIDHALVGAVIAKELGYSNELVRIIERHIGAGISAQEAERLGLPKKDFFPETPEEKIVSYADNLTYGVRQMSFSGALERFRTVLGPDHEGIGLFTRQHAEIQGWMKQGAIEPRFNDT